MGGCRGALTQLMSAFPVCIILRCSVAFVCLLRVSLFTQFAVTNIGVAFDGGCMYSLYRNITCVYYAWDPIWNSFGGGGVGGKGEGEIGKRVCVCVCVCACVLPSQGTPNRDARLSDGPLQEVLSAGLALAGRVPCVTCNFGVSGCVPCHQHTCQMWSEGLQLVPFHFQIIYFTFSLFLPLS